MRLTSFQHQLNVHYCDDIVLWWFIIVMIYYYDDLLLWWFSIVMIYYCSDLLLWRFIIVMIYYCDDSLLWWFMIVMIYYCHDSLLWWFRAGIADGETRAKRSTNGLSCEVAMTLVSSYHRPCLKSWSHAYHIYHSSLTSYIITTNQMYNTYKILLLLLLHHAPTHAHPTPCRQSHSFKNNEDSIFIVEVRRCPILRV